MRRTGRRHLAFGPLAGGWLTGKYRRGAAYPAGSRMTQRPEPYQELVTGATFDALDRLQAIAASRGTSLAGLALGWLLADERVTQVVIGPGRPEHLAPVAEALRHPVTGAERAEIESGRGGPFRKGGAVIELAEIEAARARIAGAVVRTPLVRLHVADAPAEIYLKLENLQPINSFKIRGATNAVMLAPADAWAKGLVTASAGNMAQGVAWTARELGVPATIVVPDHAPEAKIAAIERLGGQVRKIPYDDWWNAIVTSRVDGVDGLFVHPVQDPGVMAGNGTIGLEILEDLPDPDTIVIPYGGGGLTTGIASAVKALRPGTRIVTAEPEYGRGAGRGVRRRAPGRRRLPALVRGRLGQPACAGQHVAAGVTARGRRGGRPGRRGGRRGADARRAGPGHRRGRGRARAGRRAERPGWHREDRLRGLRRQHQPGQARRDPRRGRRVASRSAGQGAG